MKKIIVLFVLLLSVSANADYSIEWSSIDGGGGMSTGGSYTLTGAIGQADAGEMGGGDYELSGGFLPGCYVCIVNLSDLSNFSSYWLDTGAGVPADIDDNGIVNLVDYSKLAYYWLDYCPTGWRLK